MSEHTPTPWRFQERDNDKMIPTVCIDGTGRRGWNCIGRSFTLPDAAFIVQACNSHADLIEALRGMVDMATDSRTHGPEIYAACDAIAKAEGKETIYEIAYPIGECQ